MKTETQELIRKNNQLKAQVEQLTKERDEQAGMLGEFRRSACRMAAEAGVVGSSITPEQSAASTLGDIYFIELYAESELRLKRLSLNFERLRAASMRVMESANAGSVADFAASCDELQEALKDGNL